MPTMYKLLTQNLTSYNGMKWEIGMTNKATQHGAAMCSAQVLHCYASPEEAVLFNPIHANYDNPRLFEIETSDIVNTDGLKHACKEQTLVKELELPEFTSTQRAKFAILCALAVCYDEKFVLWANRWLAGEYISKKSANYATRNAANDSNAAYYAVDAAYYTSNNAMSAASAVADAASVKKIDFKKIIKQL